MSDYSANKILQKEFIRQCRESHSRSKVADSTGADLTGGEVLLRTMIMRRLLLREVLEDGEEYVGVLLPPSAGAVLTNAALGLCRRIAVNLNYTVTSEILNHCIDQCGIKHVLTSRKFMEKMDFDIKTKVIYLEDLREKLKLTDKLFSLWNAKITSTEKLFQKFDLNTIKPDDLMTVIFTSGSTGNPKGVMLTQNNIGSNIAAVDDAIHLTEKDSIGAFLPFFHSLGYTVTLWGVLNLKLKGVYHYSPLEAKQVGKLCEKHRVTVLLSTPTFLRSYLKRVTPEQFSLLDVVVTGAEKLPPDVADAFEQRYGIRPVEGYGTTELSPLACVNIPDSRAKDSAQTLSKAGSVGRCVLHVSAKILDPDTNQPLPTGESGMLYITGPNVMKGYLNQPEKTAEAIVDGWYKTGDIAFLDEEGFVHITGRLTRFSKIGGEMVPHINIEEKINQLAAAGEDEMLAAVTAIADERKGEKLIVLHRPLAKEPQEICKELSSAGFPNIWIPSPDSFHLVDEIPVLGTGKLDLKGMKDLAKSKTSK